MKKIAFIMVGTLPMPPIYGGAVETLVNSLVNNKQINELYNLDIYSCDCKDIKKDYNTQNINYFYINEKGILNKIEKACRFIINKISKKYIGNLYISKLVKQYSNRLKQYDYVIVENRPEYGLVLKKYISGKLIYHSHNDNLNKNKKNAESIVNCYDEIFTVSKYICNIIKQIPTAKEENVKLLYNGINIEKFQTNIEKEKERKKWGINKEDIVFLYTGRLVKEKGIMELIKAFNLLNNSKFKLLIVGSVVYGKTVYNNYTKDLNKLSKNNNNIIYTGFINYEDMYKIYSIADFGIVPSIWEDPCPLSVIEHLASGHPVITTNSGGIPELVNDNCSIIVEKENEIINNLLKAMKLALNKRFDTKKCIEQACSFNESKYINRFIDLLN